MQIVELGRLHLPSGHAEHCVAGFVFLVPDGHVMQYRDPASLHRPAGQVMQASDCAKLKVPGGQFAQVELGIVM